MINFYGDNVRWFIGIVVSNADPLYVGRCRVRIYGAHSDDVNEVPEASLPWASCLVPTTEDGVSGLGRSPNIKPGAMVFGFFMDAKTSQQPVIVGSIPRIEVLDDEKISSQDAPAIDEIDIPAERNLTDVPTRGTTSSLESLVGSNNTEKAFNFLVGNGYSKEQAAGVCGNFIVESGMDPTIVSKVPGEASFGIAQWNPAAGRLQRLESYAADRNLDYRTLETQLQFFHYEFKTEGSYYGFNKFKAMGSYIQATVHICDKYEKPGVKHLKRRIAAAKRVLETYG
jgi:hypothetical protein